KARLAATPHQLCKNLLRVLGMLRCNTRIRASHDRQTDGLGITLRVAAGDFPDRHRQTTTNTVVRRLFSNPLSLYRAKASLTHGHRRAGLRRLPDASKSPQVRYSAMAAAWRCCRGRDDLQLVPIAANFRCQTLLPRE